MSKLGEHFGMVELLGCRCRCGHEWLPRTKGDKPRVCPKCKSPYWNKPRIRKLKKTAQGESAIVG